MKHSSSKLALSAVAAILLLACLHLLTKDQPNPVAGAVLASTAALTAGLVGVIGAIERLAEAIAGSQRGAGAKAKSGQASTKSSGVSVG